MKLLIITQKVDKNDSVLGFFHRWLEEFSLHCEQVIVICLQSGSYSLPSNVRVFSLGKEGGVGRITYLVRFFSYIISERKKYDAVFVHMNQIYVILGGVLWRFWRKKVALWYTHKQVGMSLRLAEKLVDKIFTASAQSFNLKSQKVVVTGHGIDTEKFHFSGQEKKAIGYSILTVGRVTRIKNLETLIQAVGLLAGKIENLQVDIIGSPITVEDKKYQEELLILVREKNLTDIVRFLGPRPYTEMPGVYCAYDCLINLAPTGGVDKAVLEAMSCELPVVFSNESFISDFVGCPYRFYFKYGDVADLVFKIQDLYIKKDVRNGLYVREIVSKKHKIGLLTGQIISLIGL